MWKSRKFKLMLGATCTALAGALTGEITWAQAIAATVAVVMANIMGIAIEDAGAKSANANG